MPNRPLWLTHQASPDPARCLVELDHCWKPPWPSEWWVHRKKWLAARIGEREDVLDLGCGNGLLAAYLHHAGYAGSYIGIDYQQVYLELAISENMAHGNMSAIFCLADLAKISIDDKISEYWRPEDDKPVVVIEQVIEHMAQNDAERLLDSIPSGVRVLSLVSRQLYVARVAASPNDHNRTTSFPRGIKEVFAIWDYQNMRDGLMVKRVWYWNGQPWIIREEPWDLTKYGANGTIHDISIYDDETGLNSGVYQLRLYIDNVLQPIGAEIYSPMMPWITFNIGSNESYSGYASPDFQWGVGCVWRQANRIAGREWNLQGDPYGS